MPNLDELEKRIASIEQQLEAGTEERNEFLKSWRAALISFVDSYALYVPSLEQIREKLIEMELHS